MKLEPGEVICPNCNGRGDLGYTAEVIEYEHAGTTLRIPGIQSRILCDKCQGFGKLDWVENIVGKKQNCSIEKVKIVAKNRMLKDDWVITYD